MNNRTLGRLLWGLVGLALCLVIATGLNVLLISASGLAALAQLLALCGAVAMLLITGALLRRTVAIHEASVNPAPGVTVLSAMTGFLTVLSTSDISNRLFLAGGLVAGTVGLLGGTLIFVASWRSL
jgi:hypothetical protein